MVLALLALAPRSASEAVGKNAGLKDALTWVDFVALVLGIGAFWTHFLATFGSTVTLKRHLAIAGLAGASGFLVVLIVLATEDASWVGVGNEMPGEAEVLVSPMAFCVFAIAGFAISTIAFWIASRSRKRSRT